MPSAAENHLCVKCMKQLINTLFFYISICKLLQKCLYKGLCPKLSTNKIGKEEQENKGFMSTQSSNNNKRIAQNTMVLYIRMLLLMATSLYTSRVVLASLGVENFGIYNVVGGVVTCLGFLNGTLSTASSRYITVALGKGNLEEMKKVFSSVLSVNILLALIVLLLSETVGLWFLYEKMVIPEERMTAAFWVFQFSVLTILLNICSVPYNAVIIAHERMKAFAYISLFDAAAKLGVAFLVSISLGFDKLIFYAALLFLIQVIDRLIYGEYCVRKFSEVGLRLSYDKKLLKNMAGFIGWSAYGSLVSVGFTQGLNILLNMFFGPVVNAARGVAVQVQNAVNSFVLNFQTAINPQLTKNVAVENFEESRKLLVASSKYSFYLLCFLGIPIIGSAEWILSLWLKVVPQYTVVFVRYMIVISIVQSLANSIRVVNQAEGNIKKFQFWECSFLLLVVPLSYLSLKMGLSPESVFIIQLVIEFFAQFIRIAIVLSKIRMNISDYLKGVYLRIIPALVVPLAVTFSLNYVMVSGFLSTICNAIVTNIVLLFIIWVGLSKEESSFVKNKIQSICIRK